VMICGAFIYLLPLPESGLLPWMVTVVLAREFLITGIRGYLEQQGRKFGADQWGKWKMGTQCENRETTQSNEFVVQLNSISAYYSASSRCWKADFFI